jgi:D-glycero-D-manno-heptose 1,7-bisphosphate phosphatase
MSGRSAIFLDRDGTIIEDVGYLADCDHVRVLDDALVVLRRLTEAGFALVVVSNQSGIGRGLVTAAQAASVHHRLVELLAAGGVDLDGTYYCPHAPDQGCACRKPSTELILCAGRELRLELTTSFMVGDQVTDLEAGRRAGCQAVAFGHRIAHPPDWALSAADWPALGQLLLSPA